MRSRARAPRARGVGSSEREPTYLWGGEGAVMSTCMQGAPRGSSGSPRTCRGWTARMRARIGVPDEHSHQRSSSGLIIRAHQGSSHQGSSGLIIRAHQGSSSGLIRVHHQGSSGLIIRAHQGSSGLAAAYGCVGYADEHRLLGQVGARPGQRAPGSARLCVRKERELAITYLWGREGAVMSTCMQRARTRDNVPVAVGFAASRLASNACAARGRPGTSRAAPSRSRWSRYSGRPSAQSLSPSRRRRGSAGRRASC